MTPDIACEYRELVTYHERALATLPRPCRLAYTMVREQGASYHAVASTPGLYRSAVGKHVSEAQRRFRASLHTQDIAPPPDWAGRTSQATGESHDWSWQRDGGSL